MHHRVPIPNQYFQKGYYKMELNWKPCRVVHCYKVENDITHIIGFDGIIRLNDSATMIWNMANGKNTIEDILNKMQIRYNSVAKQELYLDVENILNHLASRGVLIKDWDPLLKDNVSLREEFK